MFLTKTYNQLNTQFNKSLEAVDKDRDIMYVTAKAVFDNSRNIGEEILDLFIESYPAYKNVLAIWQDLVTNSEMRPNVHLLNQLHVMMENPTKIRTQEVDTMQQILTSCDQGYGDELLKQIRASCLEDESPIPIHRLVFNEFQGAEQWWTDYMTALTYDKTIVTDPQAKDNICIKCVKGHWSLVKTPVKGQPVPECASAGCSAKKLYSVDIGATLLIRNKLSV